MGSVQGMLVLERDYQRVEQDYIADGLTAGWAGGTRQLDLNNY